MSAELRLRFSNAVKSAAAGLVRIQSDVAVSQLACVLERELQPALELLLKAERNPPAPPPSPHPPAIPPADLHKEND